MAKVEVYTSVFCAACDRAKELLTRKGIPFDEIEVSANAEKTREMTARSNGRRTVPQIFVGGEYVGGFQELYRLECQGRLDEKLGIAK